MISDDTFEGYKLPAGTNVIWNSWGVHMGESEYEQPGKFRPERWLNDDLDKPIKGHLAFGAGKSARSLHCPIPRYAKHVLFSNAGRRLCPGWVIASDSLHLLISRLLYCFDFHTVPGCPIPVGKPFGTGNEKPYEVDIAPRSPAHADLVRRECAEAANIE